MARGRTAALPPWPAAPRRGRRPRRRGGAAPPRGARWCSQAWSRSPDFPWRGAFLRVNAELQAIPSLGQPLETVRATEAGSRLERCGRLALVQREPMAAVGAHVLDQRDEGSALVGELVGHAGRHLVEGAALDDSLLLERPEPQRERARTDAVERALELAEPQSVIRQVTDDEESPLAGDDLRRPADGAFTVHHPARIAPRLYFVKRVVRARGSEA